MRFSFSFFSCRWWWSCAAITAAAATIAKSYMVSLDFRFIWFPRRRGRGYTHLREIRKFYDFVRALFAVIERLSPSSSCIDSTAAFKICIYSFKLFFYLGYFYIIRKKVVFPSSLRRVVQGKIYNLPGPYIPRHNFANDATRKNGLITGLPRRRRPSLYIYRRVIHCRPTRRVTLMAIIRVPSDLHTAGCLGRERVVYTSLCPPFFVPPRKRRRQWRRRRGRRTRRKVRQRARIHMCAGEKARKRNTARSSSS